MRVGVAMMSSEPKAEYLRAYLRAYFTLGSDYDWSGMVEWAKKS